MKKIALVGCGNIGSRHLQALAKLPYKLNIEVVEIDKNSQQVAKSRLEEINYSKDNLHCTWYDNIKKLKKNLFT